MNHELQRLINSNPCAKCRMSMMPTCKCGNRAGGTNEKDDADEKRNTDAAENVAQKQAAQFVLNRLTSSEPNNVNDLSNQYLDLANYLKPTLADLSLFASKVFQLKPPIPTMTKAAQDKDEEENEQNKNEEENSLFNPSPLSTKLTPKKFDK